MIYYRATDKLRAVREKKGITLGKLADKTKIEIGNVSRLERGLTRAHRKTATRLAKFHGMTLDEAVKKGLFRKEDDWRYANVS